jgi:hypothetical protein
MVGRRSLEQILIKFGMTKWRNYPKTGAEILGSYF